MKNSYNWNNPPCHNVFTHKNAHDLKKVHWVLVLVFAKIQIDGSELNYSLGLVLLTIKWGIYWVTAKVLFSLPTPDTSLPFINEISESGKVK